MKTIIFIGLLVVTLNSPAQEYRGRIGFTLESIANLDIGWINQPQWIVIRWTMGMPNQAFNNYIHKSILNSFNFEYVYNFFFDQAKVNGKLYEPLAL